MADRAAEILIVGGGPAGCAAARLLALWGHRVALVTREPHAHRPALAESIPPSCGKLFSVLGLAAAIDAAGFIRSSGNTVWWGEGDGRVERFGDGQRGWQVTSDALCATLCDGARAAGATIERARVTADQLDASPAALVLDCSGRAGIVARARGWRRHEPALKTVALAGLCRRDGGWPLPEESHTVIESYSSGWLWSVPVTRDTRYVTAMVDPRSSDLEGSAAREIYLAEISKAARFPLLVADAVLEGGPWGWDASMYSSTHYADDRVLLVGDAGSFIDPLSSAGVKKAIASGWLAAVVAHTALIRPGMRRTAFDFFAAREREVYQRFRSLTEQYLSDAAGGHAHPFWSDREFRGAPEKDVIEPSFARLRAEPALRVARGQVTFEDKAAVSGCEIVLERRLVNDAEPEGVRYVRDVDVVALIELAPGHRDAGELFNAYVGRHGPVAMPDFLFALSTALARGWLVWV
jgi:flavin-dependent dehydrogenase